MNRRLNRCLIAVSLSLALEASAQPEEECDQDWPTYNHDLAGSRHACDEAGPAPESARGLAVHWRFPTTAPVHPAEVNVPLEVPPVVMLMVLAAEEKTPVLVLPLK